MYEKTVIYSNEDNCTFVISHSDFGQGHSDL